MTSIATITGRGQVTIPTLIREHLNLNVGSRVIISHHNQTITLKLLPKETDVMGLYASINPKSKPLLSSINQAKKIKAKKTASQTYE